MPASASSADGQPDRADHELYLAIADVAAFVRWRGHAGWPARPSTHAVAALAHLEATLPSPSRWEWVMSQAFRSVVTTAGDALTSALTAGPSLQDRGQRADWSWLRPEVATSSSTDAARHLIDMLAAGEGRYLRDSAAAWARVSGSRQADPTARGSARAVTLLAQALADGADGGRLTAPQLADLLGPRSRQAPASRPVPAPSSKSALGAAASVLKHGIGGWWKEFVTTPASGLEAVHRAGAAPVKPSAR